MNFTHTPIFVNSLTVKFPVKQHLTLKTLKYVFCNAFCELSGTGVDITYEEP